QQIHKQHIMFRKTLEDSLASWKQTPMLRPVLEALLPIVKKYREQLPGQISKLIYAIDALRFEPHLAFNRKFLNPPSSSPSLTLRPTSPSSSSSSSSTSPLSLSSSSASLPSSPSGQHTALNSFRDVYSNILDHLEGYDAFSTDVARETPLIHEERELTSSTVTQIRGCIAEVFSRILHARKTAFLPTVRACMRSSERLVIPHRLQREGLLTFMISKNPAKMIPQKNWVYLFDDLLLCIPIIERVGLLTTSTNISEVGTVIPLLTTWIVALPDAPGLWTNAFMLSTPEEQLTCCARSPAERDIWMRSIIACIQFSVKRSSENSPLRRLVKAIRAFNSGSPRHVINELFPVPAEAPVFADPDDIFHSFSSRDLQVAVFLLKAPGLAKVKIGEFLASLSSRRILAAYVSLFDFASVPFTDSLRRFLTAFRLSGEAQAIDRVMEFFAFRYLECNPSAFSHRDTAYVLAFSLIMLNTDAHNPSIKNKMQLSQFISNNRGMDQGKDLPVMLLQTLYFEIVNNEIKPPPTTDHDVELITWLLERDHVSSHPDVLTFPPAISPLQILGLNRQPQPSVEQSMEQSIESPAEQSSEQPIEQPIEQPMENNPIQDHPPSDVQNPDQDLPLTQDSSAQDLSIQDLPLPQDPLSPVVPRSVPADDLATQAPPPLLSLTEPTPSQSPLPPTAAPAPAPAAPVSHSSPAQLIPTPEKPPSEAVPHPSPLALSSSSLQPGPRPDRTLTRQNTNPELVQRGSSTAKPSLESLLGLTQEERYAKYRHADGSVYKGYWINCKAHGMGIKAFGGAAPATSAAATAAAAAAAAKGTLVMMYDGHWVSGQMEGHGCLTHFEWGCSFTGTWAGWRGQGAVRYQDGRAFTGEWAISEPNHVNVSMFGTLHRFDGSSYVGFLSNHNCHGIGLLRRATPSSVILANWVTNEISGFGPLFCPSTGDLLLTGWRLGNVYGSGVWATRSGVCINSIKFRGPWKGRISSKAATIDNFNSADLFFGVNRVLPLWSPVIESFARHYGVTQVRSKHARSLVAAFSKILTSWLEPITREADRSRVLFSSISGLVHSFVHYLILLFNPKTSLSSSSSTAPPSVAITPAPSIPETIRSSTRKTPTSGPSSTRHSIETAGGFSPSGVAVGNFTLTSLPLVVPSFASPAAFQAALLTSIPAFLVDVSALNAIKTTSPEAFFPASLATGVVENETLDHPTLIAELWRHLPFSSHLFAWVCRRYPPESSLTSPDTLQTPASSSSTSETSEPSAESSTYSRQDQAVARLRQLPSKQDPYAKLNCLAAVLELMVLDFVEDSDAFRQCLLDIIHQAKVPNFQAELDIIRYFAIYQNHAISTFTEVLGD
ncbi:MAG: Sec7 domain-containing protein, partial [archaeon]|nr:Sec7 domain-containing protein [archaeon]